MTSGTYSTSKICSMTVEIRFAWRSDQNLKSSGSRVSASTTVATSPCWQDIGMRDGSESRHRGTILLRQFRTETKSSVSGTSTSQRPCQIATETRREQQLKLTVYFYRLRGGHNVVLPVVVIADLTQVESGEQFHPEMSYLVDSCFPWQCVTPESDFPGLRTRRWCPDLNRDLTIPFIAMYGHPHPHRGNLCHRFVLVCPNLEGPYH